MKQAVKKGRSTGGFTLVELIVVIAILGILAGVGTVAYSGYVKAANKAVDQQLVADIVYAVELAYVSDPGYTGVEALKLTTDSAAEVVSSGNENVGSWLTAALENAFGADALSTLKLKYSGWGKGAAVALKMLQYFQSNTDENLASIFNGTATPSFANDVDDLFVLIRDTAVLVNGKTEGSSGAELIQNAANLTVKAGIGSDDFARAWASSAWDSDILMGADADYTEDSIDANRNDKGFMANAVANAGVVKARNTALACYLRDNGFPELYDLFADYTYGSTIIPKDAVGLLLSTEEEVINEKNQMLEDISTLLGSEDQMEPLYGTLSVYFGMDEETPNNKDCQAYQDGLA